MGRLGQPQRSACAFLSVALVLLALSTCSAAATIRGTVFDQHGVAVHSAIVRAETERSHKEYVTTSDYSGEYVLQVPATSDTYHVRVAVWDMGIELGRHESPGIAIIYGMSSADIISVDLYVVAAEYSPIEMVGGEETELLLEIFDHRLVSAGRPGFIQLQITVESSSTVYDTEDSVLEWHVSGGETAGAEVDKGGFLARLFIDIPVEVSHTGNLLARVILRPPLAIEGWMQIQTPSTQTLPHLLAPIQFDSDQANGICVIPAG